MRPVILAQKITLKTGSKPKYSQVFPNPCPTKQLYAMVDNLTTSDVQVYMDDNVTTGGNHVYPDPSPTAVKAGASAKNVCDCIGVDGTFTLRIECASDLAADGDVWVYIIDLPQ